MWFQKKTTDSKPHQPFPTDSQQTFEKNIVMEARDLCHGPFDDRFGHIHLSGKLQLGNFSSKKNKRRS